MRSRFGLVELFLIIWPLLVSLPNLVEKSSFISAIAPTICILGIVSILVGNSIRLQKSNLKKTNNTRYDIVLFTLYVLFFVLLVLRNSIDIPAAEGMKKLILFNFCPYAVFTFVAFYYSENYAVIRQRFACFASSAAFHIFVIFCFDTLQSDSISYLNAWSRGARLFEIPAIKGANGVAFLAGAAIISAAYLFLNFRNWLGMAAAFAGVIYLYLSNSFGVTSATIIAVLTLCLQKGIPTSISKLVVIFWCFSATYAALNNSAFQIILQRSEGGALGVGTGRNILWDSAMDLFSTIELQHFWGFGVMGALKTNVVVVMVQIFSMKDISEVYDNPHTLHNGALQYVFDTGYLGLIFIVVVLFAILRLCKTHRELFFELTLFCEVTVMYILITGLNEATGTIYHIFSLSMLTGVFAVLVSLDQFSKLKLDVVENSTVPELLSTKVVK
jgi:hypothetical protein